MTTKAYKSYEEAAQEYLAQFRGLMETPQEVKGVASRGAVEIPAGVLVERAGAIADISAGMLPLAKGYLEAPDPTLREGISGQLLAQAAAELQVAAELLQISADEEAGTTMTAAPTQPRRGVRGTELRQAIQGLEKTMAQPVSAGMGPSIVRRAANANATTPEEAKEALKTAALVTSRAISKRVIETGGDLAFNLIFNTKWKAVIDSASMMNQQIAGLLGCVKEGASNLVQNAVSTAARLIANTYDKILALMGKDLEDQARQQVQKWLDDIKKDGKIELFASLVDKFYQIDQIKKKMPVWLEKTTVPLDQLNAATSDVSALSQKFTVLVNGINKVGDVIGLAKFVEAGFPQVLIIVAGIRVALLVVLVYAGYDYIGFGQGKFINVTRGVAEVIQEYLKV